MYLNCVPHFENLLGVIFLFCNIETLFQLKQIDKKFKEVTTTYAGFSLLQDFINERKHIRRILLIEAFDCKNSYLIRLEKN